MSQILRHIIQCLLFLSLGLTSTHLGAQSYEAKLEMDSQHGLIVIEGSFLNHTSNTLNLNYHLIIERKSSTGNVSNNRQSGSFQVLPNREKLVALTEINIDELDFYRIYFKIYKKGEVIAEDYIVKWEEINLELSDRDRRLNEEKNKVPSEIENRPTINFYSQKEAEKSNTTPKLNPEKVATPQQPITPPIAVVPDEKRLPENDPSKKIVEQTQNKKQTYTTPPVETGRKLDENRPTKTVPTPIVAEDAEKEERQAATKKLLTDLIVQQKDMAQTTAQPPVTAPADPIPTQETSEDLYPLSAEEATPTEAEESFEDEFGGLIIDDSRTKTGRDFYDTFYSNYIPPKGAENVNITIKELPGRGRLAQVAVLVNDDQILLRLLQPQSSLVEEQAIQSVYIIEDYLKNAAQLKKQLESTDQQGSGIF